MASVVPPSGISRIGRSWRAWLDIAASIALLVAASAVIWNIYSSPSAARRPPEPKVPAELQPLKDAATKGNINARVALIEYSDFQCPYCRKFVHDILPDLEERYVRPGRVRFIFRHLPLQRNHSQALDAAKGAVCAGEQNKFWEVHDELFRDRQTLDPAGLLSVIKRAGIESRDWQKCMAGDAAEKKVLADMKQAEQLQIVGTPFFLIGTTEPAGIRVIRVIRGARPVTEFQSALDEALIASERAR